MAFNFPASPTVNQEYTSGGVTYVWNGYGWALKAAAGGGITDAPTDGAEYVRVSGAWKEKVRRVDWASGATFPTILVPSGAKLMKFCVICIPATTTAGGIAMRVSVDGGSTFIQAAASYQAMGSLHNTGTGAYAKLDPANFTFAVLGPNGDSTTLYLMSEGWMPTTRPNSTVVINGMVRGIAYNSAAASVAVTTHYRIDLLNAGMSTNLSYNAVQFYTGGGNLVAGSNVFVEWSY